MFLEKSKCHSAVDFNLQLFMVEDKLHFKILIEMVIPGRWEVFTKSVCSTDGWRNRWRPSQGPCVILEGILYILSNTATSK